MNERVRYSQYNGGSFEHIHDRVLRLPESIAYKNQNYMVHKRTAVPVIDWWLAYCVDNMYWQLYDGFHIHWNKHCFSSAGFPGCGGVVVKHVLNTESCWRTSCYPLNQICGVWQYTITQSLQWFSAAASLPSITNLLLATFTDCATHMMSMLWSRPLVTLLILWSPWPDHYYVTVPLAVLAHLLFLFLLLLTYCLIKHLN